jgi:hypothetical protein
MACSNTKISYSSLNSPASIKILLPVTVPSSGLVSSRY